MEQIVSQWLDASTLPLLTALLLGLLTSVSPCTFATNVMVLGFIGKNVDGGRRAFVNGLVYSLGRVVTYTVLGVSCIFIIRKGADTFGIQSLVSEYGGYALAPTLVVFGLFMLFGDRLRLGKFGFRATERSKRLTGTVGALVLGLLFALAFCPVSGMLYFAMLIPMSAVEPGGYFLPVAFGVGSSVVVVLVAWIVSFCMSRLGRFYKSVTAFQKWANRVVGAGFIVMGAYYFCVYYLGVLGAI